MSTASFLMQAREPIYGTLVTWIAPAPDWNASHAPTLPSGPGIDSTYRDIAVAGGGFDTSVETSANAVVLTDGSRVTLTDGSLVTTS